MNAIVEKVKNMYLPNYRKQRNVAMIWLQELMNEIEETHPTDEVVVLPTQAGTKIYVRLKNVEVAKRVEPVGFYKRRNWEEECIWGTPFEDLNGTDFWQIIRGMLDHYTAMVHAA